MVLDMLSKIKVRTDLLIVISVLMLLDIVTGVIGALINKEFKSTIFRQGLFKKVYELLIIVVGYILDYTLGLTYIGVALSFMIIGLEAYSIVIENAGNYVPVPEWLKDIIERLKAGEKQKEE